MFALPSFTYATLSNLNTRIEKHGDESVSAVGGVAVRPVVGFEGLYAVSCDGRVWSLPKSQGVSRHQGRWLKPWLVQKYPCVRLLSEGGKRTTLYIHRLVGFAWIENKFPETRTHINHKDGNRQNNHVENLEWCDRSMNIQHAYDTGARIVSPKVIAHVKTLRQKQLLALRTLATSGENNSSVH